MIILGIKFEESLPDQSTCWHCGRKVFWVDYGYIHHSGWANCYNVLYVPDGDNKLIDLGTLATPVEMKGVAA